MKRQRCNAMFVQCGFIFRSNTLYALHYNEKCRFRICIERWWEMMQVQWMKGEKTEITKLNDAQKYRNSWKMCNYAGVSKRMRCDYRMHLWYISCFIQTFDFFRANRHDYTEYYIRKAKHQVVCALKLFGHANSEQSQKCDISSELIFQKKLSWMHPERNDAYIQIKRFLLVCISLLLTQQIFQFPIIKRLIVQNVSREVNLLGINASI